MSEFFDTPLCVNDGTLSAVKLAPLDDEDIALMKAALKRRAHGVFQSPKAGKSLPWRNPAERDLMALLEVDPDVLSMEAWPEEVHFVLDGRESSAVPALRVHRRREPRVMVMDAAENWEAARPWRRRLSDVLRRIYAERHVPYRFFRARDIRVQPRLGNAKAVLERRGYPINPADELLVVEALSTGARTIGDVGARFPGGPDEAKRMLFSMALKGSVGLDLSAASWTDMRVRLAGGAR